MLRDHGADPECNERLDPIEKSALIRSASLAHAEMVETVLARGARITAKDRMPRTALHQACAEGARATDVVTCLHACTEDGRSAMYLASA
ncbi:hypothetical protein EYC84_011284 [Monilinia fructicola]|uniref:Uncharacterized protein n=1 Tax=Monilinia fructicola TaxID=38448 RepID=A0A5M9J766_MONFR|nr:hypothetical protein EYC84_011284 [Monilinia fructicola]